MGAAAEAVEAVAIVTEVEDIMVVAVEAVVVEGMEEVTVVMVAEETVVSSVVRQGIWLGNVLKAVEAVVEDMVVAGVEVMAVVVAGAVVVVVVVGAITVVKMVISLVNARTPTTVDLQEDKW